MAKFCMVVSFFQGSLERDLKSKKALREESLSLQNEHERDNQ